MIQPSLFDVRLTPSEVEEVIVKKTKQVIRNNPEDLDRVKSAIMNHPFDTFWPDEIKCEVDQRNVIGGAFISLSRAGKIKMTGQWKRSQSPDAHGRKIFQYKKVSHE